MFLASPREQRFSSKQAGPRARLLLTVLTCAWLAACQQQEAQRVYEQQLTVCDLAQANGLLDEAVISCTAAITALEQMDTPDSSGELALRLASLERQRQGYAAAANWLERAENTGAVGPVTMGLERALVLAGQDQWKQGVEVLESIAPACLALSGDERSSAAKIFNGYARRLELRGDTQSAQWLRSVGAQLAELNPGSP